MTRKYRPRRVWHQANKHNAFSPPWVAEIGRMFRDGFGVEDIAIWMQVPRTWIEKQRDAFRAEGMFAQWWGSHG